MLTFFTDRSFLITFHVVVLQRREGNVPTCKTQVRSVQSCYSCSLNRLFCSALVAVISLRSLLSICDIHKKRVAFIYFIEILQLFLSARWRMETTEHYYKRYCYTMGCIYARTVFTTTVTIFMVSSWGCCFADGCHAGVCGQHCQHIQNYSHTLFSFPCPTISGT